MLSRHNNPVVDPGGHQQGDVERQGQHHSDHEDGESERDLRGHTEPPLHDFTAIVLNVFLL
jgi:hypothetical protein